MAIRKNPSQLLTSVTKGIVDAIPLRWRSKLGITKTTQENPVDIEPSTLTGTLVASSVAQERTDERLKTNITLDDPTGKTMVEYIRTKDGQVGTRVITYVPEGTAPPTFDELTVDFGQEASGNGWTEQILTTVPNLFGANDYSIEIKDLVPAEFTALIPVKETGETVAGTASMPTLAAGELMRKETQITEQTKRVEVRFRDLGTLPKTLVDKDTNKEKQVVTITKIWELDTSTPQVPTAIKDVKFDKLGDGTAIETRITIDAIFVGASYEKSVLNLIPEKLRAAIAQHVDSATSTGAVVVDPTLATGELSHKETQIDEFNKRTEVVFLDIVSVPTSVVSKDTNKEKQVVTITDTLQLVATTPLVPTAIKDTKWVDLGNGYAVQTKIEIDAIFIGAVYSKSVLNLIPERLRAEIPQRKHDFTETGAVNTDPPLSTGDLTRTETQIDEFNKRVEVTSIDALGAPVVVTDKGLTREFGGSETRIYNRLAVTNTYTVDTGPRILKSEIIDLNNGYEVQTTEQAVDTPWTQLEGQEYDERFNLLIPFTQQVVTPGTGIGVAQTDVKPIDKWREENRTIDLVAVTAYLDTYVLTYFGKVNIDLPNKLLSVVATAIIDSGEGVADETGAIDLGFGGYSISQSLRASAQSSASIIPEVVFDIRPFWGNNVKCTNLHFFMLSPVTATDVMSKINALLATTVAEWPKFNPELVTLLVRGGRVSVQAGASSQGSAALSAGGDPTTTGGGTSYSREVGTTFKSVRIDPTIHDEITVMGDVSVSQLVTAAASAEAVGLGPAEAESQDATAYGTVNPTTIPATVGSVEWPGDTTPGVFLYRIDAQPYRFGYIQFHAVVVDSADFPNN